MGNIPLQGGNAAVEEIDKNLKKVRFIIIRISSMLTFCLIEQKFGSCERCLP